MKVKETKYHTGHYGGHDDGYHGGHDDYGHDEHYAADEPQKKIAAPEDGKAKA